MVEAARSIGMRRARRAGVKEPVASDPGWRRRVWIVEDEPAAAELATDMCASSGAAASVFRAPLGYLAALRSSEPPMAIVLDWRLERELSAALFLATRHRYPALRVICWTGSPISELPSILRDDAHTVIIDKADGMVSFERALKWALDDARDEPPA